MHTRHTVRELREKVEKHRAITLLIVDPDVQRAFEATGNVPMPTRHVSEGMEDAMPKGTEAQIGDC